MIWYSYNDDWIAYSPQNINTVNKIIYNVNLSGLNTKRIRNLHGLMKFYYEKYNNIQFGSGEGFFSTINWKLVAIKYDGIELTPQTTWFIQWDIPPGVLWKSYKTTLQQ